MALQGSLKDLRLGDVLQTVRGSSPLGLLRVRRGSLRAVVFVSPDVIRVLEPPAFADDTLLTGLVRGGVVSALDAERARADCPAGVTPLERLEQASPKLAEHVAAVCAAETEDRLLDLLTSAAGDFRFEEIAEAPEMKGRTPSIRFDPNGVMLSAARRQDERAEVEAVLGPATVLLAETGSPAPTPEDEDDPVARVLARVDGRTTLDRIALCERIGGFAARKAACRLVQAGAARVATAQELSVQSKSRSDFGDHLVAADLYRQWHAAAPDDPAPLVALAAIAAKSGQPEDHAEALSTLGRLHAAAGRPAEAKTAFSRVLELRPDDRPALEGLYEAAQRMGDTELIASAARRLATSAIGSGDHEQAIPVLRDRVAADPKDVDACMLLSGALAHRDDRTEAMEELLRLSNLLPGKCRSKTHRRAAQFGRDTAKRVAADRPDLAHLFQAKLDVGTGTGKRRVAILASLVVVLAAVGFVLRPATASSLLQEAQDAVEAGDAPGAVSLLDDLESRFPETPEAQTARTLRAALVGTRAAPRSVDVGARARVKEAAAKAEAAFPAWPAPESNEPLRALLAELTSPDGPALRQEVPKEFSAAFSAALSKLRREALDRRDALDSAAWAAAKPPAELKELRDLTVSARRALDPAWFLAATATAEAAQKAALALGDKALVETSRALAQDVSGAAGIAQRRAGEVSTLAREYGRAEIKDAYDRARTDGLDRLREGKLEEAEATFQRLSDVLASADVDPDFASLRTWAERSGIRSFAESKLETVARIHKGLSTAKGAEVAGDIAAAATTYAGLVTEFRSIRFDDVFTIPRRITTVPKGAAVTVDGKPQGPSPVVARYRFGRDSVVTVEAKGYLPTTVRLDTSDPKPPGETRVGLSIAARWTKPLAGIVETSPMAVDGDVIVCDRAGRVERRARDTGDVRWAAQLEKLEGIRSRPVLESNAIWVPMLAGQLARLSPADGTVIETASLPGRPVGDAAALPGVVAVATERGLWVRRGASSRVLASDTAATAGVLAAHGAFWVGEVHGAVLRLGPDDTAPRSVALGGKDMVTGLAVASCGVLAVTADGAVALVDPDGTRVVWRRTGLGEIAGNPAATAGQAAVIDRGGAVHFFTLCDGTPLATVKTGAGTRAGLLSVADRLAAVLEDGRLWVFDPKTKEALVDGTVRAESRAPPADLGDETIAVPVAPYSMAVFSLPAR